MILRVFSIAKDVYADETPAGSEEAQFRKELFFPVGEPNPYGEFFTGQSYLAPVSTEQIPVWNSRRHASFFAA